MNYSFEQIKCKSMVRVLSLAMFVLISMNVVFAQKGYDVTTRVNVSKIKNKELQAVFSIFQKNAFLELPINYDESFCQLKNDPSFSEQLKEMIKRQPCSYNDNTSPFYANLDRQDKSRNDSETMLSLIKETSGDYILGIVSAMSALHDTRKAWLVTFNFSGKLLDYLPISEALGWDARIIEAQINKDFTVTTQQLEFPDNDYIIKYDSIQLTFNYLNDLKGQRVDSKYQITTKGKFEKLEEVRYQPQIYTPEILLQGSPERGEDIVFIRQRNEKRIQAE